MGYLQFIGAGCKLATVPKAAGSFHSHNIHGTCNHANDPPGNVVNTFKAHDYIGYKLANIKMFVGLQFSEVVIF